MKQLFLGFYLVFFSIKFDILFYRLEIIIKECSIVRVKQNESDGKMFIKSYESRKKIGIFCIIKLCVELFV